MRGTSASGWSRRLGASALLLLVLAGGSDFWVWWNGRRGISSLEQLAEPALILVPGASVFRSGQPSPVLRQRMEVALDAARVWVDARVVLSGTAIVGGYDEPLAMHNYLVGHGIDPRRLVLDREGTSTQESIRNLGAPSGRLVVVSQKWHLPRLVWIARDRGWDVAGLVAGKGSPSGWENLLREHAVRVANLWERNIDRLRSRIAE
jgi:SanA protein